MLTAHARMIVKKSLHELKRTRTPFPRMCGGLIVENIIYGFKNAWMLLQHFPSIALPFTL